MTKSQKIQKRIKYWIKLLDLKDKFIIREPTKLEKKNNTFSGYTEKHKKYIIICFNPKVITLNNIQNHVDRVTLHELGHVLTDQIPSQKILVKNEYLAEKYMLHILYKYNIRLYKKLMKFMKNWLQSYNVCFFQYPEHYKAFCRVYNVNRNYHL